MKKLIAATSISTLLLSGVALAETPLQPNAIKAPPPFSQIDTNKDGVLSKSEASKVPGLDFDKADADHDGKLSRAEYGAAALKMGG